LPAREPRNGIRELPQVRIATRRCTARLPSERAPQGDRLGSASRPASGRLVAATASSPSDPGRRSARVQQTANPSIDDRGGRTRSQWLASGRKTIESRHDHRSSRPGVLADAVGTFGGPPGLRTPFRGGSAHPPPWRLAQLVTSVRVQRRPQHDRLRRSPRRIRRRQQQAGQPPRVHDGVLERPRGGADADPDTLATGHEAGSPAERRPALLLLAQSSGATESAARCPAHVARRVRPV
jgi:hypothetical protein